jgi:Calcium binding
MSSSLIRRCELQEISWTETTLSAQDVEAAVIYDTKEERATTIATLTSWYSWWNWNPEQVRRIQQVVKRTVDHELFAPDRTWHAYLEEHLVVPFVANVVEDLRGPVQQGEEGKVTNVFFLDETHGTIVSFRQKRRLYHLPLYALQAPSADAQTQQLINDYAIWFSGR